MENIKTLGGDDMQLFPCQLVYPDATSNPVLDGVLFTRAEIEYHEWLDK